MRVRDPGNGGWPEAVRPLPAPRSATGVALVTCATLVTWAGALGVHGVRQTPKSPQQVLTAHTCPGGQLALVTQRVASSQSAISRAQTPGPPSATVKQ